MTEVNKFNSSWVLWYHNPLDTNWSIDSYKIIGKIQSIEDFWKIYLFLNNKIIENSMLFLMKEGIDPLWEHEKNKNGGSWSFKYQKGNLLENWTNYSINLLGEQLVKEDKHDVINGISISPKKNFCILKIWISNKENTNISLLNKISYINYEGGIFKFH